jgi:hypothetical protein
MTPPVNPFRCSIRQTAFRGSPEYRFVAIDQTVSPARTT